MKRSTKLVTVLTLLFLAVLVFVPTVQAFDGRSGDRIVIAKDEVINDDLYLGGSDVIVEGTINGDLMAAGNTVTINGKVTGDLWAAGNTVVINGEVGDDVFAAAAAVTIGSQAKVADDVFSAGAGVETQPGSQIGGDLLIGATQALVAGTVNEDLQVGTNRVRLEGVVKGNADIAVGDPEEVNWVNFSGPNSPVLPYVPGGLTFGSTARVDGTLNYSSSRQQEVPTSVTDQVNFSLPPVDERVATEINRQSVESSGVFDNIRRLIAMLIVILLLARFMPRWILAPAEKLMARPLPSLGVGLLSLAILPLAVLAAILLVILVAIILGALTLGELVGAVLALGLPTIGGLLVLFIFAMFYLPQALVAYLGGRWILQRVRPEWAGNIYGPLLVGLLILAVLIAIPQVGGVLEFIIVLFGLGALVLLWLDRRATPVAPSAVEPAPVSVES